MKPRTGCLVSPGSCDTAEGSRSHECAEKMFWAESEHLKMMNGWANEGMTVSGDNCGQRSLRCPYPVLNCVEFDGCYYCY